MTEAFDRIPLAHLDLAIEMIGESGGLRTLPVTGESMRPTLCPNDALLVDLGARGPRSGDVVLFRSGDSLVVHRFLRRVRSRRRGPHLRMRGDGRASFDPPVLDRDVRGIVRAIRRSGVWWSLEGSRARCWSVAVAWHDRFWGFAFAVAVRLGRSADVAPWMFRCDRALLRAMDAVLFKRVHRRLPPYHVERTGSGGLL